MSEFKGTKGEWDSMPANQMGVPYIIFVDNETIFQCYGENAKENMQVAKHAPEMLEMLEKIYKERINGGDFDTQKVGRLILKATE